MVGGEQGCGGKSTLAFWLTNNSVHNCEKNTQDFKILQSSPAPSLWVPRGKSLRVIDTPPLPSPDETGEGWSRTKWGSGKVPVLDSDVIVFVLDANNVRSSGKYLSCIKRDFGKMVENPADIMKRLVVVLSKVKKNNFSTKNQMWPPRLEVSQIWKVP